MSTDIKIPEHQRVFELIRDQILFGELVPGQPLTIQGLAKNLGVGSMPVRDALRRLTSEGALNFLGNRRICVPQLTREDFEDVSEIRLLTEPRLASKAAGDADDQLIDKLKKIDAEMNRSIELGDNRGYLRANYTFHFTLYDGALAPILRHTAEAMWLRVAPSLRIVYGRRGTQALPDHHVDIIEALTKQDAALAQEALRLDILQGIEQVRADLSSQTFQGSN